ncbi:putative multiple-sugar transport system permease YteP [bioreactor metagenome]|uniref:Putative multiple-sugar transport system permease YteP n=2 Tax=root TaxID=1 RepID=A0A645FXL5_9ZZZZ
MVTMFILNLGFFLNAGFDQVFNFTNDSVNSVIDILDTYIYRLGLVNGQYSLATAVGVLKGIIGVLLVLITHFISKKLTGEGVW